MVGCLVLQVLESTVTPELEGFFFSLCICRQLCSWLNMQTPRNQRQEAFDVPNLPLTMDIVLETA